MFIYWLAAGVISAVVAMTESRHDPVRARMFDVFFAVTTGPLITLLWLFGVTRWVVLRTLGRVPSLASVRAARRAQRPMPV